MSIGFLDIAIIVVLVLGLVRGAAIGLIRQTTNLVGLALTIILSVTLTRPVGLIIQSETGWPHEASLAVAFLAIFLVVKLATVLVAKSADSAVDALHLGWVNRLSGSLFGGFKAALLLSIVFLVLGLAKWPDHETSRQSSFYDPVAALLPQTWDYVSGKAPILDEYRKKIEVEARQGIERLGVQTPDSTSGR